MEYKRKSYGITKKITSLLLALIIAIPLFMSPASIYADYIAIINATAISNIASTSVGIAPTSGVDK